MKPESRAYHLVRDSARVIDHGFFFGMQEERKRTGHANALMFGKAPGRSVIGKEWKSTFLCERDSFALASAKMEWEVERGRIAEVCPFDPTRPLDSETPGFFAP